MTSPSSVVKKVEDMGRIEVIVGGGLIDNEFRQGSAGAYWSGSRCSSNFRKLESPQWLQGVQAGVSVRGDRAEGEVEVPSQIGSLQGSREVMFDHEF